MYAEKKYMGTLDFRYRNKFIGYGNKNLSAHQIFFSVYIACLSKICDNEKIIRLKFYINIVLCAD